MFSNKDIARYYDLSEDHYNLIWNLKQSWSLHYGYWDQSTKNFHEALLNINTILSKHADIKSNDKVLDAGCGVGGSSLWMAKEIGCTTIGISLSEKQVNKANGMALHEKLNHLATFQQRDYTNTGFPDESFNVVWAIESVCHAEDKTDFIKEAFRILKKGGRLIMADFFKKENLKEDDAEIIRKWAHGWAVPDFSTIEEFEQQLHHQNFSKLIIEDATEAIKPSAKRLHRSYYLGLLGAGLYKLFNKNPTDTGRKNIETAKLQYEGLKKGLWKYKIILASK